MYIFYRQITILIPFVTSMFHFSFLPVMMFPAKIFLIDITRGVCMSLHVPDWYYMWHVTCGVRASMWQGERKCTRGRSDGNFGLITWWLLHLSTDKSIMNAVGDQKELIRSKGSDQFDLPQQIIHPLPHMMLSRTSTHVIEWWMVVKTTPSCARELWPRSYWRHSICEVG